MDVIKTIYTRSHALHSEGRGLNLELGCALDGKLKTEHYELPATLVKSYLLRAMKDAIKGARRVELIGGEFMLGLSLVTSSCWSCGRQQYVGDAATILVVLSLLNTSYLPREAWKEHDLPADGQLARGQLQHEKNETEGWEEPNRLNGRTVETEIAGGERSRLVALDGKMGGGEQI
ncbi:hypothetical protein L915_10509 [Phytophthora nicotianae]|uniref:Uncharacterized protein n=1 Tax=Phytophthora nicotianae TaxID=4792 RepID=W2GNG2_PHYNI|nr:hypothetical protein L915_10509 [Phytophthora nicotianae]